MDGVELAVVVLFVVMSGYLRSSHHSADKTCERKKCRSRDDTGYCVMVWWFNEIGDGSRNATSPTIGKSDDEAIFCPRRVNAKHRKSLTVERMRRIGDGDMATRLDVFCGILSV